MTLVRRFDRFCVLEKEVQSPGWLQDLLRAWAPAGTALTNERPLRAAIRDNKIDFYRFGQTIARVWVGHDRPARDVLKLRVHGKYVFDDFLDDKYATLIGTHLSCKNVRNAEYRPESSFNEWIERSRKIRETQVEKYLVDRLVASNPGVADLEIALPTPKGPAKDADWLDTGRKSASRMDLVVLEKTNNDVPQLAFWEVKTTNDKRLRKNGEPKVIDQLSLYRRYLQNDERRACVVRAYQEACRVMVRLHALAEAAGGSPLPRLGGVIEQVAQAQIRPIVDPVPRLVVVLKEEETGIPKSLEPHLEKVRAKGFPVCVSKDSALPLGRRTLKAATVVAD